MSSFTQNASSGVIWNLGLSGSGKTTLLQAIRRNLLTTRSNVISLDGDAIRECIRNTEEFSIINRIVQFQKMQQLAREFESQGLIVLLATLYCNHELLIQNRTLFNNYFEVFVDSPMEKLVEEDNKSIYRDYKDGKLKDVVGMDIEWITPAHPDMITSRYNGDPDSIAKNVISQVEFL